MNTVKKPTTQKLDQAIQTQAKILQGTSSTEITFETLLQNKFLPSQIVQKGIPHTLFEQIAAYFPLSLTEWAEFLNISAKSLHRYKTDDKSFGPNHSEKILELAEVMHMGLEVFGDMEKLKRWLTAPSFALGQMKPIELLADSFGKELVMTELVQIEYGIFA